MENNNRNFKNLERLSRNKIDESKNILHFKTNVYFSLWDAVHIYYITFRKYICIYTYIDIFFVANYWYYSALEYIVENNNRNLMGTFNNYVTSFYSLIP